MMQSAPAANRDATVIEPLGQPGLPIRVLARRLLLLARLLVRRLAARAPDEPGAAVLRDLGLGHERPRSAFDFADIHHDIEWSRMRTHEDHGRDWRGS